MEAMTTSQDARHAEPSADAWRLYDYLRLHAYIPGLARTDAEIAEHLGLSERSIVRLSDELLRANIDVVARCVKPFGRWVLLPGDPDPTHWAEAREYAPRLRGRGVSVMSRAVHAERAFRVTESQRAPAATSTGQGQLF